jgi:5-methylcytosine-specific restriction endonuclease McrBC GTP-binding regulatory subunit McrB
MSEAYDKLKGLVSKIEDTETKSALDSLIAELNKERGVALSDLNKQKEIVNKSKQDVMTLTEIAKAMNEAGVEVKSNEQMIELAKNFGSKVDESETNKALNKEIQDREAKLKEMEAKLHEIEVERTMTPLLENARKEFKDADGNEIYLIDDFINKDALKKVDTTQEVLVNKAINDTLLKAQSDTEAFLKRNNLDRTGEETHSLGNQDTGIKNRSQGIAKVEEAAREVWNRPESTKSAGDLAWALAQARIASEDAE